MSCNGYKPRFQDQINDFDPLGPLSCTCYSGAMAGDYDTCGTKVPTGKRVRELTGDRSGGTTLPQVDAALNKGWGIDLDTRIGSSRLTWAEFEAKIDSGRGAILQGSYSVIHGTKFAGDTRFKGNHAMYIPPGWAAMDPLCDGRRAGIYKYHGEVYPRELLKKFAGTLVLDPKTGRKLGYGYAWCSLTRDNTSTIQYRVEIHPATVGETRSFYRYFVTNGIITGREVDKTSGFSASCTAPKLLKAKSGLPFLNKSLVRLLEGSRKGWYVESRWAKEV